MLYIYIYNYKNILTRIFIIIIFYFSLVKLIDYYLLIELFFSKLFTNNFII